MMTFQKGAVDVLTYPVNTIPQPHPESEIVSPRVGQSHGVPRPTFPGDIGFDLELEEVIDVRMRVLAGEWPAEFLAKYHPRDNFDAEKIPAILIKAGLTTSNPRGCANIVHMDHPLDLHLFALDWLQIHGGLRLRVPETGHKDFLQAIPRFTQALAERVMCNLDTAFEVKYFYGRPRPEELVTIPKEILTEYPEGCPCHPAYIAGHSAAAAAVTIFAEVFHLRPAHIWELQDAAYMWGMFRTFAGVHYANDNTEAFDLFGLWGMEASA
jgi:hypothetical protein